jgi:hypothetical protein
VIRVPAGRDGPDDEPRLQLADLCVVGEHLIPVRVGQHDEAEVEGPEQILVSSIWSPSSK